MGLGQVSSFGAISYQTGVGVWDKGFLLFLRGTMRSQDPGCQDETQARQVGVGRRGSAGGRSTPVPTHLRRDRHSVRVGGGPRLQSLGVWRLQWARKS